MNDFFTLEKRKFGQIIDQDPDLLESLGKAPPSSSSVSSRRKSVGGKNDYHDEDDDDFSPTVKEKERRAREKRKEAAKRVQEGDYLTNIKERSKVFSQRKDNLIHKVGETDSVCATKTFLVIINMDQEAAYYHGDPSLVTKFFTFGVSSRPLLKKLYNVRPVSLKILIKKFTNNLKRISFHFAV